jgi:multiple sugar transport system permease protein
MKMMKREVILYIILAVVLIVYMSPILWLFSQSIKREVDIFSIPPVWIPSQPTFQNYAELFNFFGFGTALANTITVTGTTLIITLALAIPAAYGLSRYKFPGSKILLLIIVACRMIVPPALLVPLYSVLNALGLINSPIAIVVGHLTWTLPLGIWLLIGFFDTLPEDIEEAAMMDGMSTLQLIARVVLPVSAPGIAVVSLFTFMTSWNEFMFASIFATSYRVGGTAIAGMVSTYKIWWGDIAAGGLIFSIPMIIVAIVAQKYIVQGLTYGAIR